MKRLCSFIFVAFLYIGVAFSQENPRWIRHSSISHSGGKIAFSYKGDIYVADSKGGEAHQITSNPAFDSNPLWTKDDKQIVFTSTREGSGDIFIVSADGGYPKRLTFMPGNEEVKTVLDDGRIIFSTYFQEDPVYGGFPGSAQLYITDTTGIRPKQVTSLPIMQLSVNKDGTIIYEDYKGYEDNFRKHHTSAVTRDIWKYVPASSDGEISIDSKGKFTKLSTYEGEDRQPVFAADGNTYYYISERDGKTANIYRSSLKSPSENIQLTFAEKNPVRYVSVSDNGLIAYSYNGDLYTLREGEKPEKLKFTIRRDSDRKDVEKLKLSSGATDMAVSPNGKEIAIVARGDVFVTSIEHNTTRRITDTPQQERNVSFSEDGRTLYYSSERDGFWGIYRTSLDEKKEKYFTYATKFSEELFSDKGETCFQPMVSPDGKYVAYLRDRTELVVKPTKGGKTKSLLKGANYSYSDGDLSFEWSPDSRYLLSDYQGKGGWNNPDIAVIDVDSGEITDLTESGYADNGFRWVLDGKAMIWKSDKYGFRSHGSWGSEDDIYIMFFDPKAMTEFKKDKEDKYIDELLKDSDKKEKKDKKDSTSKKVEKIELVLEGRENRIERLTNSSGFYGDIYLKGDKLYYISKTLNKYGLCELDLKERNVKVLKDNVSGSIYPSKDGNTLFLLSGAGIYSYSISSGESKTISFSGDFDYKPQGEREYIFAHVWKQVLEKFYDPTLRGLDWNYYRENYSSFLPYINNDFDFAEMLSEMLGELNGSHTGARYYAQRKRMAYFGALFDLDYAGDGLLIKEVLPGGVLVTADPEIKAGDVIKAVNGTEIKAGQDYFELLTDISGKKTELTIDKKGGKTVKLFVEPASSQSDLMYRRWVRQREEMVQKLSDGRIGYVHVRGMNSESFREVYSKTLGKYRNCEAIIVDTRNNGGGWLHDDLITLLSGKAYIKFMPRGQYIGTEPHTKWTKPSCVLVSENNYSDASAFPYIYQTLGIGKVIGMPVPGTMTAVWWENQINPLIVFGIPQVGSMALKERRYQENMQLEPDIKVENTPESVLEGKDRQLEAAVKEMMKEINEKKQEVYDSFCLTL